MTGEAFVKFVDDATMKVALQKHRENMGGRFIELFRSSALEMRNQAGAGGSKAKPRLRGDTEGVVRVRGLPFSATEDDITNFFKGLEIADRGVHFVLNRGQATGKAYIVFKTKEVNQSAPCRDQPGAHTAAHHPVSATARPPGVSTRPQLGYVVGACPRSRRVVPLFFTLVFCLCDAIRISTVKVALSANDFNRNEIGGRYIEVFQTDQDEMMLDCPALADEPHKAQRKAKQVLACLLLAACPLPRSPRTHPQDTWTHTHTHTPPL